VKQLHVYIKMLHILTKAAPGVIK